MRLNKIKKNCAGLCTTALIVVMCLQGCSINNAEKEADVEQLPAKTAGAGEPNAAAFYSQESDASSGVDEEYPTLREEQQENRLVSPHAQTYYFGFDESRVSKKDIASIDAQANYLIRHPESRVRLEGHTDKKGTREYNIALGWDRARAVERLMEQLGVSPKQIVIVSYGKEKPAVEGMGAAVRRLNRRTELVFEKE